MQYKNVESATRPKEVEVFPTHHCYMRRNIRELTDEEGNAYFMYDEVFFVNSQATEELILANFTKYWVDGIQYGTQISLEERVSVLEELMEEIIDG